MSTDTRRPLRPQQRSLSWGDHWILPLGDPPSPTYIAVGHVLTQPEVAIRAQRRAVSPEGALDAARANLLRDSLDCLVYNRANSTGAYQIVTKREVWPIRPEVFRALKRAGYDPRNLPWPSHGREGFASAFANWKAMVDGTPPPRRPFVEFINEAEQLVRIATSDRNPTQVYLGYNRVSDRHVVMRLADWGAENAAIDTLERHGFRARHGVENSIYVEDRSEVSS